MNIPGTNVAAPVVPYTTEDTYPSHIDQYGKGGWRRVQSVADLNDITPDRLSDGMAVYVRDSKAVYVYDEGAEQWELFSNFNNFVSTFIFSTWAELDGFVAAYPAVVVEEGFGARVLDDAGTHNDPVTAEAGVPNEGVYRYHSDAPIGWERVANLEVIDAKNWADGTEPGGPGTKSAKEWADDGEARAQTQVALATSVAESVLDEYRSILMNNRYRSAKTRRRSGKKGRIFLTVGQSLSVRRNYTNGQPKIDWTSPHAYMIVGGADRNADADVALNLTSFNADGADYESLVQFVPGSTQGGKVDGYAMMADVPTVCGIYAIGARDYTSLRNGGSSLFKDTAMFMSQAVKLLRDMGCEEIEFVFSFSHGEAETDDLKSGGGAGSGAPTPGAVYKLFLTEWFRDLTFFARMALDDPDYEPIFLVHQLGGVFNDDWRAIMEATSDFADEYSNVHLAGPTAPYGFQADRTHPPGEAQGLMGEWDWHLTDRALAGLTTCLKAHEFRRDGATIYLPHTHFEGSVQIGVNAGNMTDASGFNGTGTKSVYGVEVLVNGATVDINAVTPAGLVTQIDLAVDPDVDPGGTPTVVVRLGMMTTPGGNATVPDMNSRCNIRSDWAGIPSRYIPSFKHEAWQLHDEIEEAA